MVSDKHFAPVGTPLAHQAVGTPVFFGVSNSVVALCGDRGRLSRRDRGSGWSEPSKGVTRVVVRPVSCLRCEEVAHWLPGLLIGNLLYSPFRVRVTYCSHNLFVPLLLRPFHEYNWLPSVTAYPLGRYAPWLPRFIYRDSVAVEAILFARSRPECYARLRVLLGRSNLRSQSPRACSAQRLERFSGVTVRFIAASTLPAAAENGW